jgi:hypothetical protein
MIELILTRNTTRESNKQNIKKKTKENELINFNILTRLSQEL